MRFWPVPESYRKIVPAAGQPGSFWENRGDRRHAGVDIFAPVGSAVIAIEGGAVLAISSFTSPSINSYWNETVEIFLESASGTIHRYAELGQAFVAAGDIVDAGERIGTVGCVLNSDGVEEGTPPHVRRLVAAQTCSMLHFEMYQHLPPLDAAYSGGNYFLTTPPADLIDPTPFLSAVEFEKAGS